MKTRTPWRPLLRNELLLDHFPIIPWIAGAGYCLAAGFLAGWAPLAMLTNLCHDDIAVFFSSFGDAFFPFTCLWLFVVLMWIGAKTGPGVMAMPSNEFYFTRAIARRSLFRARMIVLGALVLSPLVFNMFLALRTPDLVLNPENTYMLFPRAKPPESYLQAFPGDQHTFVYEPPGDHNQAARATPEVRKIILRRGALAYSGWLLWAGTLGLLAMQSYCVLMAKHVSRRWGSVIIFAGLPFLPAVFLLVFFHGLTTAMPEVSFLFFARHKAVLATVALAAIPIVQWWAERRFDELEIS